MTLSQTLLFSSHVHASDPILGGPRVWIEEIEWVKGNNRKRMLSSVFKNPSWKTFLMLKRFYVAVKVSKSIERRFMDIRLR